MQSIKELKTLKMDALMQNNGRYSHLPALPFNLNLTFKKNKAII